MRLTPFILSTILLLLAAAGLPFEGGRAIGQVRIVSPLPAGVLQVRGDHADLKLRVHLSPSYSDFRFKLSSDIDTSNITDGWHSMAAPTPGDSTESRDHLIDTLITVPRTLRSYTVYWRADSSGVETGGLIGNLTPGHIIGIAGQSNAEGYCWEMVAGAWGDIRMLKNDRAWEPAHEPTGGAAGGPWIVMANLLYSAIGDSLPIGIVNVAAGGSGIMFQPPSPQWFRNAQHPEDSSIYGSALHQFRAAGGEIECLAWIQGESDVFSLASPDAYRSTFAGLMREFASDLADTFQIFHLQIHGISRPDYPTYTVPQVREAQRLLPPSIIAGTAVGRSVAGDGFHYDVTTLWAVGRMFAGAILKERYGISTPMYPPLMPDTVARLDSILDGSIPGRFCFSLNWNRTGKPVRLTSVRSTQYFALHEDDHEFDTSEVWYRISLDSTRILTGLRHAPIDPSHAWKITYDPIAGANTAPLATIDAVTGDTVFATAFYELPVGAQAPSFSVKPFIINRATPTPASQTIRCYIWALQHQATSLELRDSRGAKLRSLALTLEEGQQEVSIPIAGLASGDYWIVLSDGGSVSVEKAVILH